MELKEYSTVVSDILYTFQTRSNEEKWKNVDKLLQDGWNCQTQRSTYKVMRLQKAMTSPHLNGFVPLDIQSI